MNSKQKAAWVMRSATLDELLSRWEAFDEFVRENDGFGVDDLDISSLPTFGGAEPTDTAGIWSWDETRLLAGEGDVSIVTRTEWNAGAR